MPKRSRSVSKSRSTSKPKSKSKSNSNSRSNPKKVAVLQKKVAFLKLLKDDEHDYLSVDIIRSVTDELDKTMKKYNKAANIIQKKYKNFRYKQSMYDEGYIELPCGLWTNGAQCMCDICMPYSSSDDE